MTTSLQTPMLAELFGCIAEGQHEDLTSASLARFEGLAGPAVLRLRAVILAAGEIDALAKLIRSQVMEEEHPEYVIPGLVRRVLDLTSVVLSVASGDGIRTTLELYEVVCADEQRAAEVVGQAAGVVAEVAAA